MRRSRKRGRLSIRALVVCALAMWLSGCASMQMPRIDPTGRSFFLDGAAPGAARFQADVGSASPENVGITLSPYLEIAPVGSEVVLLAGVQGDDGYLRTNRRLEWSLSSGSVGQFVAVEQNGFVDLLVGDFNRPRLVSGTFAIGSTSRRYAWLNRGTASVADDVYVLRGQGWISVTSPVEGSSHIVAFAPGVAAWNSRMRSATIHWIDAQWRFPAPSIGPSGSQHVFTTTVDRLSNLCPCSGWIVRYEIVDGPPAAFAPDGTSVIEVTTDADGRADVEIYQTEVGPGTNKIAIQIIRPAALGGMGGKRLVVSSGATLKTWTAADLAVRKTGPSIVTVGATFPYRIDVSNPGDLPTSDVVVVDTLPAGLEYIAAEPAAQVVGGQIEWRVGTLAAGENRVLELQCRSLQAGDVTNRVDASAANGLEASHAMQTRVVAPTVDVSLSGPPQVTVGGKVAFRILVVNRGPAAVTGLVIRDQFDAGLEHTMATGLIANKLGTLGPGQSQEITVTFRAIQAGRLCHTVEITDLDGGTLATAEGCVTAVVATPLRPYSQGAITPEQPIIPEQPDTPAYGGATAPETTTGRPSIRVTKSIVDARGIGGAGIASVLPEYEIGDTVTFAIRVENTGTQTLTGLVISDQCDSALEAIEATDLHQVENGAVVWRVAALEPGKAEELRILCKCAWPAMKASNRIRVITEQGVSDEAEACLLIHGPLKMTVLDWADPIRAGKELTYEVEVTNDRQTPQWNLSLTVAVPQGMHVVLLGTASPGRTKWNLADGGRTIRFAPVPELLAGEKMTYRIRMHPMAAGQYTVRAELTGGDLAEPLRSEQATEVY